MQITWTTERGSEIKLAMDEQTTINADGHKVATTDHGIILTANGKNLGYQEIAEYPDIGLAIRAFGNNYIPVPEHKAEEIKAMAAERKRRLDESSEAARENDAWKSKIEANR